MIGFISDKRADDIRSNAIILIKTFGYTQFNESAEIPLTDLLFNKTIQSILNYCNITRFPKELDYVAAQRLAGEYLFTKYSIGSKGDSVNDGTADGSAYKKITEGDTTVEKFGSNESNDINTKQKTAIDKMRDYGLGEVARFKCLSW